MDGKVQGKSMANTLKGTIRDHIRVVRVTQRGQWIICILVISFIK